jgi:hypothetical protein
VRAVEKDRYLTGGTNLSGHRISKLFCVGVLLEFTTLPSLILQGVCKLCRHVLARRFVCSADQRTRQQHYRSQEHEGHVESSLVLRVGVLASIAFIVRVRNQAGRARQWCRLRARTLIKTQPVIIEPFLNLL